MAAPSCSSSLALILVVVACAAAGALAVTHVVGSNQQWGLPQSPNAYNDWANGQTFSIGDTLVFNFATGFHDVLEVTRTNYDACNFQSPVATHRSGPATVGLNTSGAHYYVCSVGTHCLSGQRMTVTVSSAASAPSPPPSSRGPTTPRATANPPSSTPTAPSPPPTSGGPTTPAATANPPATSSTPASPGPSSGTTRPSAAPSNGIGMAAITAGALAASVAALVL